MLISVHIPKVGGRSFKELLKSHFAEGLKDDYGDHPLNKSFEERTKDAKKFDSQFRLYRRYVYIYQHVSCIHGHFMPYKYISLLGKKDQTFITWMRDPLERLASQYYYWKRTYDEKTSPALHQRAIKENWSFEKFCFSEEMQNFYSKFYWKFPIEKFDFIGITEHFDTDITFFAKTFLGVNDFTIVKTNVNPNKGKSYFQDEELINKLKLHHYKDYEIYNYALQKRFERG